MADSLDELKEKERYWIQYYHSYAFEEYSHGYNMTRGGDSPTHENTIIAIKRVNILTGEIVEHFNSIAEAERKYNRGINETVNKIKNIQIPKGYTWLKEEEEYNQKEIYLRYKVICRLDLKGKLLDCWLNSSQAAEECHLQSNNNINACLVNLRNSAQGYQWCYYKDLPTRINKSYDPNVGHKKRQKKVAQYDLCGNLINIWESASIAAKETNTLISKISAVCHGKQKTTNGYKWKYVEE